MPDVFNHFAELIERELKENHVLRVLLPEFSKILTLAAWDLAGKEMAIRDQAKTIHILLERAEKAEARVYQLEKEKDNE